MKTYEQEKHDLARDYAREIPGHDEEMAFRHGYDAGHARAQARIAELEAEIKTMHTDGEWTQKCDSLDAEIRELQAKLESCEAEKVKLTEQNKKLLNEIHQGEHLYLLREDVKPLLDATLIWRHASRELLCVTNQGQLRDNLQKEVNNFSDALQAFREKNLGVV